MQSRLVILFRTRVPLFEQIAGFLGIERRGRRGNFASLLSQDEGIDSDIFYAFSKIFIFHTSYRKQFIAVITRICDQQIERFFNVSSIILIIIELRQIYHVMHYTPK